MHRWLTLVVVLALVVGAGGAALGAGGVEQAYIVNFVGSALPADAARVVANAGGRVGVTIPQVGVLQAWSSDPAFPQRLAADPRIWSVGADVELGIEPVEQLELDDASATTAGADLYERYQWHIKQVTGDGATFAIQPGHHGVIVAVLDTGVDWTHPALAPNYLYGKSFVPGESPFDGHSHGTHVAGTVAGVGRIRGVAPGAGIANYKVLSNRGFGFTSWITAGIVAAADDGVDVINMSLGGYRLLTNQAHVASAVAYIRAIQYASRKGVVVVVAAGNSALDLDNPNQVARAFGIDRGAVIEVPGGLPNLITVSSSTRRDTLAYYSNYGASVIEVAGPGGDLGPNWPNPEGDRSKRDFTHAVLSSIPGNRYAWFIGTSMATPHVAGAAAALRAQYPGMAPQRVRTLLQQTADDLGPVGHDDYFGHGRVNLYRALGGR